MNHYRPEALLATVICTLAVIAGTSQLLSRNDGILSEKGGGNYSNIDDLARKIDALSRQLSSNSPMQTADLVAIPHSNSRLQTAVSMSLPQPEAFSFVDYSPEHWKLKKSIYKRQSLKQHSGKHSNGRSYFQYNWEPEFTCDFEERIGAMGDGGKWVCNAYKIAKAENCSVLSIGSLNDYGFETAMHNLNSRCKIHTFDHTVTPTGTPPYVNFHRYGLGSESSGNILTMKDVIDMAGFQGKVIDVLKIDCEGCEFNVYKEFSSSGFIRQILMEIHFQNRESTDALLQAMHDHGYIIFHKEPNTYGCSGDCIEYAFLKTNFTDP
jgi:hypothetical protein